MIAGFEFEKELNILHVLFNSGRMYSYVGVSEEEYLALSEASSKGRYMRSIIIPQFPALSRGRPKSWVMRSH
jgi:hypothetical protein